MTLNELQTRYGEFQHEATSLAGGLEDIPRRAMVLNSLYFDSGRNHVFTHIAAHGALWAYRYFEVGGRLGRLIANRYFYSKTEKAYRLGILNDFAEGFRKVNRQVCIDTYANYHFTKQYHDEPDASQIVSPTLLDALNRIHSASRAGRELSGSEKRLVFEQSFRCEQEVTVAPGVKTAVDGFQCRIMKFLCMKPLVRFAYFPSWRYLWFHDFSNQSERIEKGLIVYDLAARVGWSNVESSLRRYGLLRNSYFESPASAFTTLRNDVPSTAASGVDHPRLEIVEMEFNG